MDVMCMRRFKLHCLRPVSSGCCCWLRYWSLDFFKDLSRVGYFLRHKSSSVLFSLPVIRIKHVRYQKYEIKTTLPMYTSSCAGELMILFFEEVDTNVANTVVLHRVASRKETLAVFLFCAWFSNGLALQFLIATPSVYLRRMRYHFAGTCSLI